MSTTRTYTTIPARPGYFVVDYQVDENGESKQLKRILYWEVEQSDQADTELLNDMTRPVTEDGVELVGIATENSLKGIYGPGIMYAVPPKRSGMDREEFMDFARAECRNVVLLKSLRSEPSA